MTVVRRCMRSLSLSVLVAPASLHPSPGGPAVLRTTAPIWAVWDNGVGGYDLFIFIFFIFLFFILFFFDRIRILLNCLLLTMAPDPIKGNIPATLFKLFEQVFE